MPFTLFFGAPGQIGTSDITNNPQYALVVDAVNQLRARLLNTVYNDNAQFTADLKPCTPVADHVPKIPTDGDVVDFLTNAFPNLYLSPGQLGPAGDCGETHSGRGLSNPEKISINVRLVQLWLEAVSEAYNARAAVPSSKLWFMFIAMFLHELGHSSLVWYGMGACNNPQLGGIEREAGDYIEKTFFGGISCAEFELDPNRLLEIGLRKDGLFYPLDDQLATKLTTLDTSRGLPVLDFSTLTPAPPATFGRFRSKFSQTVSSMTQSQRAVLPAPIKLSETRVRPLLMNDKVIIMPGI